MANQKMSEFIEQLAAQTGLDTNSEKFQEILKDESISKLEAPEGLNKLSSLISENLLSINTAKNHKDVAGHFKLRYYRNVEKKLGDYLRNNSGLDEEKIAEIEAEPDTLKRMELAFNNTIETVKASAGKNFTPDGKVKEVTEKYNALLGDLNKIKSEYANKEKQWSDNLEKERTTWEIDKQLSSYKFSDNFSPEDAKLLISNKLSNSPYVFKRDNSGKIGVYQKENPELLASDKNKTLELKDVLDTFAAPYIKKVETNNNNNGGTQKKFSTPAAPQGSQPTAARHADKVAENLAFFKERMGK